MRSLSILLCGYGWFAGIPEGETNNAERIARALDGEILARGDARARCARYDDARFVERRV